MSKFSFKKAIAAVAAMSLVACAAAVPTSAADGIEITVDTVTLTLSELEAMDYKVPVGVAFTSNAGLMAYEFGIKVDDRCTYVAIDDDEDFDISLQSKITVMAIGNSEDGTFSWFTWASATTIDKTGYTVIIYVTVPETAEVGDFYTVDYLSATTKDHLFKDSSLSADYVASDLVTWIDGGIEIVEDEEEEPSEDEEDPSEDVDDDADVVEDEEEETDAEEEEVEEDEEEEEEEEETEAEEEEEEVVTTATPTTVETTTVVTVVEESSPKTAGSDVLPIAGAAAAVAVLGAAAFVAKKKD